MDSTTPFLDSWTTKFVILATLLGLRYLLAVRIRPQRPQLAAVTTNAREFLDSALVTLALTFLLIQPFIAQAYWIPTGSMDSTLPPNDRILSSRLVYKLKNPQFQDVVVFKAPSAALAMSQQPEGTNFVKRCVGVPGDVIEIRKRGLFRNGVSIPEPYARWDEPGVIATPFTYDLKIVGDAVYARYYDAYGVAGPWFSNGLIAAAADQPIITAALPGKVPAGKYLMLGDHRNNSRDGHEWGFVDRDEIQGKAFAVFWPPQHWGLVDRKSKQKNLGTP